MKAKREAPKRRDGSVKSRRTTSESGSARRTRPGNTSAPAREARAPKSGPQTSARPVQRSARPASRSQAKARSKARKAKAPRAIRPRLTERLAARLALVDLRPRTLASKVPFVVLIIGSLALGLGLTLWLSTASAERSYQPRHKNRILQQQKEALERDVRDAEAAPALAEAARKQGMIPTRDTAHLVQDPTGSWVVVGTPKPADGVQPPPLNAKLPEDGPPAPPKGAVLPPEVPVRLQPAPGGPPAPASSGPEALLRAPDGSATVGGQHLPQTVPQLPAMPGGQLVGQVPGTMQMPGLPAPAAPVTAPVPAEVPIPISGLPVPLPGQVPAPLPAEVPVPVVGAPLLAAVPQPVLPQPVPPQPVAGAPR